jgi:hypothetical protein
MTDTQQPLTNPSTPIQVTPVKNGNGFGVASLILGILALVGAFVPFLNYGSIFVAGIGVVLGVVGLVVKFRPRGTAIAGLILSALGLILAIVMVVIYTAVFFGVSAVVAETKKAANVTHTVVYTLTGDSTDATATYSTFTDGKSAQEQATGQKLPFSKTITAKGGSDSLSFNSFTLSGTNGADGTDITCDISVDGKSIATQTSSGAYASVTCSGSN